MYNISITPYQVHSTIKKHLIGDGFDITFDLEKSQGVHIYDSKHNRTLLDFFTCFASVPLGYNHPHFLNDDEFKKNLLLAALTNPSNSDIYTTQYAQFVDTFSKLAMPADMPHAFFIAGGGLAIENALKTAMDYKVQKNFKKGSREEKGFKVIHFEHAFHGRTGYTLSLTNSAPVKTDRYAKFDWPRIITPILKFPVTDENLKAVQELEKKSVARIKQSFAENPDDVCAIIIEPVQAEGGDNHIRKEFFEQLRILADENDCFLIYDEVQTGVGLSGTFWCHEHFGPEAKPDILVFGKKMQVCGIVANNKVDEIETNVFNVSSRLNSTWGGSLVDMVRATKILEVIHEDDLVENAAVNGTYLQKQLQKTASRNEKISNVRGKGLLTAFDFPSGRMRDDFIKKGLEAGAMFLGCGETSIRFRPALIIEKAHIDAGIEIIEKVLPVL